MGEKGPPSPAPSRRGSPCIAPPEKPEPPRAGCPGRGGQHGAPRDAPVPLRAWCMPPMPLYSSSTRSAAMLGPPACPAPPRAPPARSAALSFPPPAPERRRHRRLGLGGRSGKHGLNRPRGTKLPIAQPAPPPL